MTTQRYNSNKPYRSTRTVYKRIYQERSYQNTHIFSVKQYEIVFEVFLVFFSPLQVDGCLLATLPEEWAETTTAQ